MSWLSNLSDTERWAFGLLAFLCIAIVSHMLATGRDRQARCAKACADFNAAVLDAFSGLYPIPKNWPSDKGAIVYMLEERFPLLQAPLENSSQTFGSANDGSSTAPGASFSARTAEIWMVIGNTYVTTGRVLKRASDTNMIKG